MKDPGHTREGEEGESVAPHSEESETIGGIDLESTPLIVLGVVLSLALAGAALSWPRHEVFAVGVVFSLGFAVLDGRELARQLDEDVSGVATLAALALALHLAAAAVAAFAVARTYGESREPAAA